VKNTPESGKIRLEKNSERKNENSDAPLKDAVLS
jgi:hypothetical protein